MKIKILVSCSGTDFSFRQSETVEVSSELGKDLVAADFTTYIAVRQVSCCQVGIG